MARRTMPKLDTTGQACPNIPSRTLRPNPRLALRPGLCQGSVEWQLAARRMFRWFEHHQVYAPSSTMAASGADLGRPFEDVYFTTSDGVRLNGWFFPADKTAPRSHLVFLLL